MTDKNFSRLQDSIRDFAADRDWDQFHSPKNLAMALGSEAGELLEQFQWLTESESKTPSAEKKQAIADEVADVLIYLLRLADKLDIDLIDAAFLKIRKNAEKYPAERVRGSMKKYTEYGQ
jgi:NTP pyrophosphatase (non-canonical NTP hydrolase)